MKASVRYMFHNPEDVKWFKVKEKNRIDGLHNLRITSYVKLKLAQCLCVQPVEVWSKCGRRGRVKEPVGTHGKALLLLEEIEKLEFCFWNFPYTCELCRGNEMHIQWSGSAT